MATVLKQGSPLRIVKQNPNLAMNAPEAEGFMATSTLADESSVIRIKRYLQQVLFKQYRGNFIKFPSMLALMSVFEVSAREIRQVLNEFQTMGFDYEIIHDQEPILVWDKLVLSTLKA